MLRTRMKSASISEVVTRCPKQSDSVAHVSIKSPTTKFTYRLKKLHAEATQQNVYATAAAGRDASDTREEESSPSIESGIPTDEELQIICDISQSVSFHYSKSAFKLSGISMEILTCQANAWPRKYI